MNNTLHIRQIAAQAQLLTRQSRCGYAKKRAIAKALPVQQVDFVETFDYCVQAALDADEITVSRAVEMFERLEHYLDCLEKYYARNREMAAQAELLNLNSKGETNDLP